MTFPQTGTVAGGNLLGGDSLRIANPNARPVSRRILVNIYRPMRRRLMLLLSLGAAILVFCAGLAYTAIAHRKYESTAELVLVPTPTSSTAIANLTSSFANSGTLGTYVEYLSSINPRLPPGSPHVSVSVRGVPASQAITVSVTGPTRIVQAALQNVLTTAQKQASNLNNSWAIHVIKTPSSPSKAGPSKAAILVASILIALLAAIVVYIVLDRLTLAHASRLGAEPPGRMDGPRIRPQRDHTVEALRRDE